MISLRRAAIFTFAVALPSVAPAALQVPAAVFTDHTNGIYRAGETVHWSVRWRGEDSPPAVNYTIKLGDFKTIDEGELHFKNSQAELATQLDAPGSVLLEVKWTAVGAGADGKDVHWRALGGAVASPEKIGLSAERPADFDAFWEARLKDLEAVPANPQLTAADGGNPDVNYWKITMDNIRGSKIRGQIARPKSGEKFPALLIVQWAGVYGLHKDWVTRRAAHGWLALNIEAHDLPIDESDDFYEEKSATSLRNYPAIGNDGRETSYFLRMYLSCYRAAEYLANRPDWNGRTLVVMGDSQGGLQTFVTAALHPKITAGLALVPAGCDMLGPDAGRKPGWPFWISNAKGKELEKVRQASRYYDVANFASQIKCPMLVGLGLIDETCPPAGVFAALNQVTAPKEVVVLPNSGHQDYDGSQAPFRKRREEAWLPALRDGKPPPINQ